MISEKGTESKEKKASPQLLIVDFCNVRTWSPAALQALYDRYRIAHAPEEGFADRSFVGSFCITREDPERQRFPLGPEGAGRHNILWEFLRASQDRYKTFLDGCVQGTIDSVFLNRCLRKTQIDDYLGQPNPPRMGSLFHFFEGYLKEGRQWKLRLQLGHGIDCYPPTLETALDGEIINLFLTNRGDIFGRIEKCLYCENYFVKRRKDQKHCDKQCRRDRNNLKTKETGRFKEYMRMHRIKGVYVPVKNRHTR